MNIPISAEFLARVSGANFWRATRSLLQLIEKFLKESDMPPSVFGRAAVRDPRLVADLRGGRDAGRDIICRVEHFMNKWRADFRRGRVTRQGDRRRRDEGAAA